VPECSTESWFIKGKTKSLKAYFESQNKREACGNILLTAEC